MIGVKFLRGFVLLHLIEHNLYHLNQRGSRGALIDRICARNMDEVQRGKNLKQRLLMNFSLPSGNKGE